MRVSSAAWALICSAGLCAAADLGAIHLEVRDQSGAPMVVAGTLSSPTLSRDFQTGPDGKAEFDALPFGQYRIDLSKPGFAYRSIPVAVTSARPVSRSVRMALEGTSYKVDVVAATPLAGVDLERSQIPTPVQTANAADLENSGALDISDFLNRRLNGIYVNDNQSNPFQPDVSYRGYTASPILGTPQGLSVYVDGVRVNQPFGDVVSWDLIPRSAISEMTLMPGSNPLFGLNTLGGALSVSTKSGDRNGGTSIQALGGMYGRRAVEFEHGGANAKGLSWFLTGNLFHEDGWRIDSPSDVRQIFGKLGWRKDPKTSMTLSFSYADNTLTGNGLQEKRFLDINYASVYTIPDFTFNHAPFLNWTIRQTINPRWTFSGSAYWRYVRADTYNADLNTDALGEDLYTLSAADIAALTAAGYTNFPVSGSNPTNTPFPSWQCIAQALQNDNPDQSCNGLLTSTYSRQQNYGAGGQATRFTSHGDRKNQLTIGAAFDGRRSLFQQATQYSFLNPNYTFTAVPAWADGSQNPDGSPVDARVDLHGAMNTGSVFATDTLTIGPWNLTASGRYNDSISNNVDRLNPTGTPGSLTSRNTYGRFNPAAGVTYDTRRGGINLYFSYSEGSRAPTSIEIGCADPTQPCNLPNALAADPPLKQVVTRTLEAGARGKREAIGLDWSAGWFHGVNSNDILFVASPQTGYGYFKNFGRTLRDGFETDLDWRFKSITAGLDYTFLNATYQTSETVDGSSNSSADSNGDIQIQPGDRIPQVPKHSGKAYLDWRPAKKLTIDAGLVAVSSSYARGNENNLAQQDGVYYLGPGTSPGYAVVNLGARYNWNRHIQFFAQINNVANRRYYTAAQLGTTAYTSQGTFVSQPFPAVDGSYPLLHSTFYAPGAPRAVWGGMRFTF